MLTSRNVTNNSDPSVHSSTLLLHPTHATLFVQQVGYPSIGQGNAFLADNEIGPESVRTMHQCRLHRGLHRHFITLTLHITPDLGAE